MPKALPIDWTLAQSLYVCGGSMPEIARRLNVKLATLRKRRERHGWRQLKAACVAEMKKQTLGGRQNGQTRDGGSTLAAQSQRVREMLSAEVSGQLDNLASIRPGKRLDEVQGRAQTARTIAETAKTVFGWDADSARRTVINVAVMESALAEIAAEDAQEQPATDVESTPTNSLPDEQKAVIYLAGSGDDVPTIRG